MSDYTNKAKCSWITPDGGICPVLHGENHDYELPEAYVSVAKAENVCIRVSCFWGWDRDYSHIQLPNRISNSQKSTLSKLDDCVDNFRDIDMYYFVDGRMRQMDYDDLIKLL